MCEIRDFPGFNEHNSTLECVLLYKAGLVLGRRAGLAGHWAVDSWDGYFSNPESSLISNVIPDVASPRKRVVSTRRAKVESVSYTCGGFNALSRTQVPCVLHNRLDLATRFICSIPAMATVV
jgi:hypothetical protein